MKSKFLLIFIVACILQISAPIYMIGHREGIIKHGERYSLKIAPVDPYDAFRGRYMSIRLQDSSYEATEDLELKKGSKIYLLIKKGAEYDRIADLFVKKPKNVQFIKGKISYVERKDGKYIYHYTTDINRYYLQEERASEAENQFRSRSGEDSYVEVTVKDGELVCTGLIIGEDRY